MLRLVLRPVGPRSEWVTRFDSSRSLRAWARWWRAWAHGMEEVPARQGTDSLRQIVFGGILAHRTSGPLFPLDGTASHDFASGPPRRSVLQTARASYERAAGPSSVVRRRRPVARAPAAAGRRRDRRRLDLRTSIRTSRRHDCTDGYPVGCAGHERYALLRPPDLLCRRGCAADEPVDQLRRS